MQKNWRRGYRTNSRNGKRELVFKAYEFNEKSQKKLIKCDSYENISFEFCEFFEWDLSGIDVKNIHINSSILSDSLFENCNFKVDVDYQASLFMDAFDTISFYDCVFENISLGSSTFDGCRFHNCKFVGCDFQSCDMKNNWFHENEFSSCVFNNNRLEWCIFKKNTFEECVGDYNEMIDCSANDNELINNFSVQFEDFSILNKKK